MALPSVTRYSDTTSSEASSGRTSLYIFNKAVSLAAVFFIACSYLVGRVIPWHNDDPRIRLVVIKFCGLMGLSLAGIHGVMSLGLWSNAYYPAYFADDGKLNLQGELAITLGVVGLWALAIPGITTLPTMAKSIGGFRWKRSQRMGYVTLALVALHLVALGAPRLVLSSGELQGRFDPKIWDDASSSPTILGHDSPT